MVATILLILHNSYAKGRVRSRKPESVINEVKEIVKEGIKEVVITGIHVASYGKDFEDGTRLIDLLEKLNKIEGLKQNSFRFTRAKAYHRRICRKTWKCK